MVRPTQCFDSCIQTQAGSLRAELLALRAERDTLQQRLRDADATGSALEADAEAAQEAADAQLRSQGEELAAAVAECERQRRGRVRSCGGPKGCQASWRRLGAWASQGCTKYSKSQLQVPQNPAGGTAN
jgi:hypothetical protein